MYKLDPKKRDKYFEKFDASEIFVIGYLSSMVEQYVRRLDSLGVISDSERELLERIGTFKDGDSDE